MKLVDLHIHTNHSDGLYSVEEIIGRAEKLGLKGLSITDHDTFNGIAPALDLLKKTDSKLFFVAGCEFSTFYEEVGELHVLAYFSDNRYKGMFPVIREFQQSRIRRAHRILECLQNQGITIKPDEVIPNETTPVGRMHIARKIVNLGYYETTEAVFEKLLRAGAPCYVPRRDIKTLPVIKAIKDNGGKAVLAHPTVLYNVKYWQYIDELVKNGLDGIETRHPKISHELAVKIEETWGGKLILTGGSDFHGDTAKEEIGKFGIELSRAQNYFPNFTDN